jgi:hypothetical protein
MTTEEISRKLGEHTFLKLCKQREPGTTTQYSFEQYWEKNKEYFAQQTKIYLEVKECLEEK